MNDRPPLALARWFPLDESDSQIARIVRRARREAANVLEIARRSA